MMHGQRNIKTVSFVMSVRLSAWVQQDGFPSFAIMGIFMKTCRNDPNSVKIGGKKI